MKDFFKVMDLDQVLAFRSDFPKVGTEEIPLTAAVGRILAEDVRSDMNLPYFRRTTVDGYAIQAASGFGASESNPAYLTVSGVISMGESPDFSVGPGKAARISTGGMLPRGADSVVMIEHTEALDETTIEVYKSVAPGQNVIEPGEDFQQDEIILSAGRKIRPQEMGLLAAFGRETVTVYRKPVVSIISTGDEIVPINQRPGVGQIRDINSYTLAGLVREAGGTPLGFDIVRDDYNALLGICSEAVEQSDMVLISGGSSVGMRDFTIEVLADLPQSEILVHGISVSPGKPTILARVGDKPFWGLPGHVVSAMVIFVTVVRPFIEHATGLSEKDHRALGIPARLSRNLASAQGRVDFVRVRLVPKEDGLWAEPVLGKSGLINTMIRADGLIEIGRDTEGLDKGEPVLVMRV
ncbi:molybdopterin molybdenumtransferase MoeA [Desulfonema ishimotonii]|uniref:Molybdopterin molybdenumtransferase n=1 Tax=Desulfonema ishimotonii TaxID=45657 RepID=A0A401FZG5_9BACT|nr:gephyrin-like molybdotransferase Glp [Desulfonema ishimotonii]GBC62371.1 molybdopterin molybdenumtransferase MoeA [Desulfonema ishimotonii]